MKNFDSRFRIFGFLLSIFHVKMTRPSKFWFFADREQNNNTHRVPSMPVLSFRIVWTNVIGAKSFQHELTVQETAAVGPCIYCFLLYLREWRQKIFI